MLYFKNDPLVKAFEIEGSVKSPKFSLSQITPEEKRYWETCLHCGKDKATLQAQSPPTTVTRAHLITNSKALSDVYKQFGTSGGYMDDFDPGSKRNHIPLCGTKGERNTCHDDFDNFRLSLLYDPFKKTYYFYSVIDQRKVVNVPSNVLHLQPYRRILCYRARKMAVSTMDVHLLDCTALVEDCAVSHASSNSGTSSKSRTSELSVNYEQDASWAIATRCKVEAIRKAHRLESLLTSSPAISLAIPDISLRQEIATKLAVIDLLVVENLSPILSVVQKEPGNKVDTRFLEADGWSLCNVKGLEVYWNHLAEPNQITIAV